MVQTAGSNARFDDIQGAFALQPPPLKDAGEQFRSRSPLFVVFPNPTCAAVRLCTSGGVLAVISRSLCK